MAYNNKVKFVDIKLDEKQKLAFARWRETELEKIDPVERLAAEHYKVTIQFEEDEQTWVCWLVPQGADHKNAGYILSCRSDQWMKAVVGAYYRHAILKKGNWYTTTSDSQGEEWDY